MNTVRSYLSTPREDTMLSLLGSFSHLTPWPFSKENFSQNIKSLKKKFIKQLYRSVNHALCLLNLILDTLRAWVVLDKEVWKEVELTTKKASDVLRLQYLIVPEIK